MKGQTKEKKDTYWKAFLGIPRYKFDWYVKFYLYKIFGFTFDKLKDQRDYWNTRGEEYFGEFFETEYYKYEIFFQDMLVKELKGLKFESIFEAGCGFGWNVKRIKQEFPEVRIGGLDFSLPQLKNSRHYQPDVIMPVVEADNCSMPFKDDAFDIGFAMGVFMNIHPSRVERAIDELLRVSKKYIIHIEWDQDNTTAELRGQRIFKTNIISHNYREIYSKRRKKVLKFLTYKDFGGEYHNRFPASNVKYWRPYEGAAKYILTIVEA